MAMRNYDCCGYATRYGLRCSDGRTILPGAFKHQSGEEVPVVWNHQHDDVNDVLGRALLESRKDGMYAYVSFNDTPNGAVAKKITQHKDIGSFSICANNLQYAGDKSGGQVTHGMIRELSLVLASANPGASIDDVVTHGEVDTEEIVVFNETGSASCEHGEVDTDALYHSDNEEEKPMSAEGENKTVKDVFETLNEEQKTVVYAIIGQILADAKKTNEEEEPEMKHNAFEQEAARGEVLTHSDEETIFSNAKKGRLTLKESVEDFLEHSNYGVENIDQLFPEYHELNTPPKIIDRDQTWVTHFFGRAKHLPFSRVKTTFANITADEARAKGYVKGKKKAEQVITLAKRATDPQTVYVKQKLDRDDVIDISDFEVASFVKGEMRGKLNEEIVRAALIGDGREAAADDKISTDHIRPIWTDDELFATKHEVAKNDDLAIVASAFIDEAIRARKGYRGSGNPTMYTSEDMLAEMLLLKDKNGHRIYKSVEELATAMRVKDIVTVPQFSGLTRETTSDSTKTVYDLLGIAVNPIDYAFGADKGGAVSLFDGFDIDFNQMKYLSETRCSGALINPKSAMVFETKTTSTVGGLGG